MTKNKRISESGDGIKFCYLGNKVDTTDPYSLSSKRLSLSIFPLFAYSFEMHSFAFRLI